MSQQTPASSPTPDPRTPEAAADPGPEKWVRDAIAEQEEYIKRRRPCQGHPGRAHAFRTFGKPAPDGTIAGATMYQACIVCGVTETNEDYHRRLGE